MKVQGPGQLVGQPVLDVHGRRVGVIRRVLCAPGDRYTAQWAIVTMAPLGCRARLVPLADARHQDRGIQLPHRRALVAASPRLRTRSDEPTLAAARAFYDTQPQ